MAMVRQESQVHSYALRLIASALFVLACAGCSIHGDVRPKGPVDLGPLDGARTARAAGQWDSAVDGYQRALFQDPGIEAAVYLEAAQTLCAAHHEDDAHELLSRGLSHHPDEPVLLAERACLSMRLGFHRAAERDLEALVRMRPADAEHWMRLGQVRLELDLPRAACAPLQRAVELEPSCIEARRLLAHALGASDAPLRGAALMRECVQQSGGVGGAPGAWLLEGARLHARADVVAADPDGAREVRAWLVELRARDPRNAASCRLAGCLSELFGEPRRAIDEFEAAVVLDPTDLCSLHHLVQLHIRGGELPKAVAAAKQALELERDKGRRSELMQLVARGPQ
jgi:tetratricopeptide (TPR) repeat protein